jgi:DNA mismatch repair protein PMS2
VRLKEHGLDLIEVADNGRGVDAGDYAALALKYTTSKISRFGDLEVAVAGGRAQGWGWEEWGSAA